MLYFDNPTYYWNHNEKLPICSMLLMLWTFAEGEKYYVAKGCLYNVKKDEAIVKPKSYQAGVRCCSCDGKSCQTHLRCPDEYMSYDDAKTECHKKGLRLCTKEELHGGVCCNTGGNCNGHLTWTSLAEPGMHVHISVCWY